MPNDVVQKVLLQLSLISCQCSIQAGRKEPDEGLDMALVHLGQRARDLKRHLRRAVVDHVSDAFLDTRVPLLLLIDAARQGDQAAVEEAGAMFMDHAQKLVEVSTLKI